MGARVNRKAYPLSCESRNGDAPRFPYITTASQCCSFIQNFITRAAAKEEGEGKREKKGPDA